MVEGEKILGRFTVGQQIGRGGHGTVHRAWDERLCRHVALKSVEGEAARRVMREAHAAARLNHPGIVTLYELGEYGGTVYLVSELVNGPNLRQYASSGRLSDRDLAEIGAELCGALSHAHAQGVIHRDIKPDNILIRNRTKGRRMRASGERAMLADFGIAAVEDEPTLTATGQVVGTLAYMAPEQATGESAGAEADVYSLALTLYELWTGSNPVVRSTPAATARAIGEEITPLEDERPELPPALCAVIDACLVADPEARPDLDVLRLALERVAGSLHPERSVPEPDERPHATPLPEEVPERPFAVLVGAGLIAALGVAAGRPGLALIIALLLAPAALLLNRPSEWISPGAAPLLGIAGLAPIFLIWAANHARPAARASLAALAWVWTGLASSALGLDLGVLAPAENASGWATSGPTTLNEVVAPLLTADALAVGLIWVGAAVILGALLEVASPASILVGGLVWAAGLAASLGAVGGAAAPSPLLPAALAVALGVVAWDAAGRPEIGPRGEGIGARLAALFAPAPAPIGEPPARPPRNPAAEPPAQAPARAQRAASRHIDAALHGAGSRAGLP